MSRSPASDPARPGAAVAAPRWLPRWLYDTEVPLIVWVTLRALWCRLTGSGARARPEAPRRILVAHHLLLGDTMLLAPLLAQLRARYQDAEIVLTTPLPMVPLFAGRPYGVEIWPFGLRRIETVLAMARRDGFDLAFVPGDNRHAWLAAALRARWIIAHGDDRPRYKNWLVDEVHPLPAQPAGMGDIFAALVTGTTVATRYRAGDWPTPSCRPFERPAGVYAVLHVGASTPLKYWPDERWRQLAAWLSARAIEVVWSCGQAEAALVERIDPQGRHRRHAGSLDLAQLCSLLAGARLTVSLDTGVAHLSRLTGTPTVTLFGPGSATLFGRGQFFADLAGAEITVEDFHCRDQRDVFRREAAWIRRCRRSLAECDTPLCMAAIGVDPVVAACQRLLASPCAASPGARALTAS